MKHPSVYNSSKIDSCPVTMIYLEIFILHNFKLPHLPCNMQPHQDDFDCGEVTVFYKVPTFIIIAVTLLFSSKIKEVTFLHTLPEKASRKSTPALLQCPEVSLSPFPSSQNSSNLEWIT